MLQIGQKTPSFKLLDTNKAEVSSDSFKGKNTVLFFFPMAGSGACTKEMCAIAEDFKSYSKLDANVVGISVDSWWTLKKFAEENKIEFPLLSDYNRDTIKAFDIVLPEFAFGYKNLAKRATFVLDREGIIRFIEVVPQFGDQPNLEAIKNALNAISKSPITQ